MKPAVKDFMTALPQTVGADIELAKAEEMMVEHDCRHLPVLEGGRLVGVISDRDLALVQLTAHGEKAKVKDAMTPEPFVVDPEMALKEVASAMLEQKIGSAIVRAKEGQSWGIFTVSDALRALAHLL